ncbi:MAG: tetratricopeptide repeat protein, partial [candidate division Zixibacteria bacterium]|nr:tetratricopeptide repeat protein [candidate division KSB1 bacterium]NIV08572.1 tetratricopeptide repeat protein [candidate division Zixibacteria bacterium]NIV69040.1 tetratricopeptide repeat protein [Phycisphaerae bacterium]NIT74198.1 tetratricopeptide repeat protein [candidate division KSB1 bacterium]NIW72523.1 tetratricopeptide repeat protein [candidate division KSB1 bacterium]
LYRLAYAYFEFQKPRESIPLLQKLLDIYQSHTDEDWRRRNRKTLVKAQFLLAKSYYRKRRYDEALALIQKLLNQDTKHFVALEFKFYALGKILAALNREEEALRYLKQALDPQHPQPYVLDQTGRVYHQLGDYPEALQQYSRALKIRKLPFIFANRAETYLAIDKIGLAVRDLHQALKRDRKGKHKIYLRLGQINLNGGKLIEAFHYFQSAIRYKQKVYGADYAEAHYALVFYHLQNDQQDLARREMQTALEITPNLEWDTSLREVLGMQPVDENYSESYF